LKSRPRRRHSATAVETVMELSVQNLYGLVIRSRLLPLDDAKKMYARWLSEGKDSGDVGRFAQWMVANAYVTEYQAGQLARGHADHFFLDQYKVLDRIGKGRMAGVYKAVHPLGQTVAIKVLPPSRARDARTLRRFQREARMAIKLNHPHVVRTYHLGESDGLHYLVMEYLEGEMLDEVLHRRGKLPPAEAVRLVHQTLTGLQHVHDQGFVHRDLKPGNLMLVPGRVAGQPDTTLQATVKILDIGLGRPLTDPRYAGLTSAGTLLGTPDYMAPEQASDPRAADIRADIYSLGCVFYHALTGRPPFPDTNVVTQMIRHATEPPRPMKELNAAVPDGLQPIVTRMLAKDPAQRYAVPAQAAKALEIFLVAGNEPSSAENDPKLRSYLTWVEVEGDSRPGRGKQASARTSDAGRPTSPRRRRRKPKSESPRIAIGVPFKPPPAAPTAHEFDVELVPVPSVAPTITRQEHGGLRRRDFIAFALGAGAVLLAILIGWIVALLHNKPPVEQ
jgi:serine/threonine protein kinase